MYEFIQHVDLMILVVGMCLGSVVSTGLYIFASYRDFIWARREAQNQFYNNYDWSEILFHGSYWDQRFALEIALPEVA